MLPELVRHRRAIRIWIADVAVRDEIDGLVRALDESLRGEERWGEFVVFATHAEDEASRRLRTIAHDRVVVARHDVERDPALPDIDVVIDGAPDADAARRERLLEGLAPGGFLGTYHPLDSDPTSAKDLVVEPDGGGHWYRRRLPADGMPATVDVVRSSRDDVLDQDLFEARFQRELIRSRRTGTPLALILVEERSGPDGSGVPPDALHVAVRPGDSIGRVDRDRLAILLPGSRRAEAVVVADRLRAALASDARVGIVRVSRDVQALGDTLLDAEFALAGDRTAREASEAEGDPGDSGLLRILAQRGGLRVVSQPIRDLRRGLDVAREWLSRGPEGPFENPSRFLGAGIETRTLTVVDLRCLRNCLDHAADHVDGRRIHVNVLPSTLIELPEERLRSLLGSSDPRRPVCVEISEHHLNGDPAALVPRIDALRAGGVEIALDDVGFDRGSLEAWIVLRPDRVKIDPSGIRGIDRDPGRRRDLRRLLHIAERLDTEVVAEGIETADECATLSDLGVAYGQGHLWGPPA